ncbi:hypothetical protein BH09GEM1_BH09GEM1_37940 [soil metagenome]
MPGRLANDFGARAPMHRSCSWLAAHGALMALAVFTLASQAIAQTAQFRQLTPDDGLVASQIGAIMQDSRGFMWLGSLRGLDRYDGYTFVEYKHKVDDSTSLADNRVNAIYEDHNKTVWIGTNWGLSRYDRGRERFVNYRVVRNDSVSVQAITEAHGKLLVGTDHGLYVFDGVTGKSAPYGGSTFSAHSVFALYEDRSKHVWIGTETAGAFEQDPATGSVRQWVNDKTKPSSPPGKYVRAFQEDPSGAMWVGYYDAGLTRIDRTTGLSITYSISASDPLLAASRNIRAMLPEGSRGLWVGTENGGLEFFDFATRTFKLYRYDPTNPSGINSNSVWALARDQGGAVWAGTFAGGVNITKQNGDAIHRFRSVAGDPRSLSFNSVISFAEDSRSGMWVATDGGGLNAFDRATGHFTRYNTHNSNLNSDAVLGIAEDKQGMLWVGTWAGGISRFNPKTGQFTAFTNKNSGLASNNIFGLQADRAGQLWIGTFREGLQRYDPAKNTFASFPISKTESEIRVIREASDGNLMLSSGAGGFAIFDPRTAKVTHYLAGKGGISGNQVNAILETEPGIVFIGTSGGLDRLDRRTNTITHFTDADGLASSFVAGLALDGRGHLWVSGDRGITRFDPATRKGKVYTAADGLQGSEFNVGSAFRSRDGTLYFGGPQGFNTLRPDSIIDNAHVPAVAITGFQLFNKAVPIGGKDSPLDSSITVSKRIDLSHDQSVFALEFAALDFTAPQKNQYAYKLDGQDKDWNQVGNTRVASYTNLPSGSYTFRVKGSNNDGVWNAEGASIEIHVHPPFWASWWFRTLLAMAAIALAWVLLAAARERRTSLERVNVTLAEAADRDRRAQQYLESNVLEVLGAMERFSGGDLAVSLRVEQDDAIGKLRGGFNTAVTNIHSMVKQVRDVLDATVATSRHIHGQTVELSRGAEEQIDQATLVSTAAQQIALSVAGNTQTIAEASDIAHRSGAEAHQGGQIVRDTFAGMDDIVASVTTSATTVAALGRSSTQIGEITRVIEQINDQAELLSLNAAIEAARAGVHGRSFAVVAHEMGQLAQRTADATNQIAKVIATNQREVERAVSAMSQVGGQVEHGRAMVQKAGGALDGIIGNAERMVACIQQVRASSEEQSATTTHITETVATISQVTHSAVRSNQTIASSVQELSALIEDLQRRVSRFQLKQEDVAE